MKHRCASLFAFGLLIACAGWIGVSASMLLWYDSVAWVEGNKAIVIGSLAMCAGTVILGLELLIWYFRHLKGEAKC
ncbi:MAG: hypothetical protein WC683_13575 [bacterium]